MAKNDKLKDAQDVSQDVMAQDTAPIAPMPEPIMPVQNQQALHDAAAFQDPNQALQPGREYAPAFGGMVGDLERLAHDSEVKGKQALSADIQALLLKIGAVRNHINEIESKVSDDVKPLLSKVLDLFKK